MNTAMIFAAGRGERMRPLTDHTPKPLLQVGGRSLIERQIAALAGAGIQRIVINHAWLGDQFEPALGDGRRWNVELHYSAEHPDPLETAGGIARALPLLLGPEKMPKVFIAVAGDIFSDFDYGTLRERAAMMARATRPAMHLVMVPNPPYHPDGDFFLEADRLSLDAQPRHEAQANSRLTFGSIGLYDTRSFSALAARTPVPRMALAPMFREAIAAGRATGECFDGQWANVGTPADLEALARTLR